ncbi:unnamed protein product [Hanseniaspora opuntiae]
MSPKKKTIKLPAKSDAVANENSHDTFSIDPDLIHILQDNTIDNLNHTDDSILNQHKHNTEVDIYSLNLEDFISLVLKERKVSFKDLTVESLQQNDEPPVDDVEMEEDNNIELSNGLGYEKFTIEQFEKLKKEAFTAIGSAINESSLLLELVSLLLTGPKPKQGLMTMSPYLKQHLPAGSVNSDKISIKQMLNNDTVKNYLTKMAWKLQTMANIEEYNEYNFKKLNEQMLTENKYWSIIADSGLFQKGALIKNYSNNTLGVKYGVNLNQFASLNIINQKVDEFEVQVIPNISSHKILSKNSDDDSQDDVVVFKYLSVEVWDKEKIISKSTLPENIMNVVMSAIKPNELSAQLERLNELQFQELIFKTLKLECKNNNNLNNSFSLKDDNTIEIVTNSNKRIVIIFESLLKSKISEINEDEDNDSNIANNILEFIKKSLLYLNKLRCFNNVISPPIYYSKKRTTNPSNGNYATIMHNLLMKINHKYIVKLVSDKINEHEALETVSTNTIGIQDNQKWKYEDSDNEKLRKLKMELNSFSALTEISETTFEVKSTSKDNVYKFTLKLDTPNSYHMELLATKTIMFENISELLDYITFI